MSKEVNVAGIPRRVLVAGARGLLGAPTVSVFRRIGAEVKAVDLPEMDITDQAQVARQFNDFKPDLVINCAAYTQVDACEQKEELARTVNGLGAGLVAEKAAACAARLIHISTDYVFEGDAARPYREDDPTGRPEKLSAYGRSKLLGEQLVRRHHPSALIVRTAWLYGPDGVCFPKAILQRARQDGRLRVVNDQTGSPTYAPDLAAALDQLARLGSSGVVHVTNSGACTWYEFACEIVRLTGLDVPVTPVATAEFPRPARRPAYSVLDNSVYIHTTGRPLRSWPEAVAEYVRAEPRPPALYVRRGGCQG
jgi:dTDP-4-dehydrorhamnose reductase